ncbi:MAG TPA: YggT family protein [Syntrophobacteraceae bacterium]|nr:YggT family protein [Syntrophobacteraceae bacterium]
MKKSSLNHCGPISATTKLMEPEMFIIAYFLRAVADILHIALNAYMYIVIARAILSWVSPDPYNPIVRFLYNVTEPVLYRIRRAVPLSISGIDFTPIILIVAIIFLDRFIVPSLYTMAAYMGGV